MKRERSNTEWYLLHLMQSLDQKADFEPLAGFANWLLKQMPTSAGAIHLLAQLCSPAEFHQFREGKITDKELFRKTRIKEKYNEKLLQHALAGAVTIVEQYVAHRQLVADPVQVHYYVAERLAMQPNDRLFYRALRRLDKALGKAAVGVQELYRRYQRTYLALSHRSVEQHDPGKNMLQQLQQALHRFTRHVQLQLDAVTHANRQVLRVQQSPLLPEPPSAADQLMTAYLLQCRRPDDADPMLFDRYWTQVEQLSARVEPDELKLVIRLTINWLTRRIREGRMAYMTRMSAIIKGVIANMDVHQHWLFSEVQFINNGILIGQQDVATSRQFCQDSNMLIPADTRQQCIGLVEANLCFLEKNYPAALRHLRNFHAIRINKFQFMVRYHPLAVCMVSEEGMQKQDMTTAMNALEAYKQYIRRKKALIPPEQYRLHRGLIRFVKRLHDVVSEPDKKHRSRMAQRSLKELRHPNGGQTFAKAWLKEVFERQLIAKKN
jgi:hypothetical protein